MSETVTIIALVLSITALGISIYCVTVVHTLKSLDTRFKTRRRPSTCEVRRPDAADFSQNTNKTTVPQPQATNQLPPTVIAPGIQNPPRPKGGFGSKN